MTLHRTIFPRENLGSTELALQSQQLVSTDILRCLSDNIAPKLFNQDKSAVVPKSAGELELIIEQAAHDLRVARVYSAPQGTPSRVDVAKAEIAMIESALLGVAAQAVMRETESILFDHDLYFFLHELEGHARSQGDKGFLAESAFKRYEAGRDLVRHVVGKGSTADARGTASDA